MHPISGLPDRVHIRHGTQTLIASFDVVTGEVQGTVGDSRTEADFVAYLEALLTTDASTAVWRIVCDNLIRCQKTYVTACWPWAVAVVAASSQARRLHVKDGTSDLAVSADLPHHACNGKTRLAGSDQPLDGSDLIGKAALNVLEPGGGREITAVEEKRPHVRHERFGFG